MIIISARIYGGGGGGGGGVEINIWKVKFIGLHIWSRVDHEWTHTYTYTLTGKAETHAWDPS